MGAVPHPKYSNQMNSGKKNKVSNINTDTKILKQYNYKSFFIDPVIYIFVMFLVREIRIPNAGFITNGLINSFTTIKLL